jgi:arylsulfatase A-like enzyme
MASAPWTLPSHVSLLTGLSVTGHRVTAPFMRIDPARRLLAEHLHAQGYRTAGFVSAPLLHRAYGFDRGFDTYENFQRHPSAVIPPPPESRRGSHGDQTAPQVVDAALAWLTAAPDDAPFFLFVHLWDAHYDYIPPPPFDAMFTGDYAGDLDPRNFEGNERIRADMPEADLAYVRGLYDGEIRWVDTQLGRLFEAIRARDARAPVLFALTADHGEEFFEHGKKGHMKALYEESIHVPGILRFPGVLPAGLGVSGPVSLDDVAPTLLGLAGLPPLPDATGRDLSAALRAGDTRIDGEKVVVHGQLVVLRGPGWKVLHDVVDGYAVMFDLASDPGEQDPLPVRRVAPERLEQLRARLEEETRHADALHWEGGGQAELDEDTEERLRSLGYIE